jgi:hypothetical protein
MKSGGVVRADVKRLLIVHKTDSQLIEKADATNNVYWEILGLSEIHDGFPLEIADGYRDFMSVSDERAGGGADSLPDAGFQFKTE